MFQHFRRSLTALALLLSLQTAMAQDYTRDGIEYTKVGDSVLQVTGAADDLVNAIIANSIDGMPVTSIGEKAFYQIVTLKNVIIPEGITSIGKRAFRGCTVLSNVTLPASITSLGDYAFYDCGNNGTMLGITLCGTTPCTLGKQVFDKTNNCTISVPSGCADTYKAASGWSSYSSRIQAIARYSYYYYNGVKYYANTDSTARVYGTSDINASTLAHLVIPETAMGYKVTGIWSDAFHNSTTLKSIALPSSVTGISGGAFYECDSLTSVEIPSSVTSIGSYAFYDCDRLSSVTLNEGLKTISVGAFYNCSNLSSITIPSTVISIQDYAFRYEGTTEVILLGTTPCSLSTSDPFYSNVKIYVPYNTVYTYQTTPGWMNYAERIEKYYTGLEFAVSGVRYRVTSDLTQTVDVIGNVAKQMSRNLVLPADVLGYTVSNIAASAFEGCNTLQSIQVLAATPTKLGEKAFDNTNDCPIFVPTGSVEMFKAAKGWSDYATRIVGFATGTTFTVHGIDYRVSSSEQLTAEVIGASTSYIAIPTDVLGYQVTAVAAEAFADRTDIVSVSIGNKVTAIGKGAFAGCSGMESVAISESIATIADSAFYGCDGLTSLTLPSSTSQIGTMAFYGCSGLESITIGNETPCTLGAAAFDKTNECTIYVPFVGVETYKSTEVWKEYADRYESISGVGTEFTYNGIHYCIISETPKNIAVIEGSEQLAEINIPETVLGYTVTEIGEYAFEGFDKTLSILLPATITKIGESALAECKALTTFIIPENVTELADDIFGQCYGLNYIAMMNATPCTFGDGVFDNTNDCALYVPAAGFETYKAADGWSEYADRMVAMYEAGFEFTTDSVHYRVTSGLDFTVEVTGSSSSGLVIPGNVYHGESSFLIDGITDKAFMGRTDLEYIKVLAAVPCSMGDSVFHNSGDCHILVPALSLNDYKQAEGWSDYADRMGILLNADNTLTVDNVIYRKVSADDDRILYAYGRVSGVTEITIHGKIFDYYEVQSVRSYAFRNNTTLQKVTIEEGVQTIGQNAFQNCSGLTSLTLPEGLKSIDNMAFEYCSALTSITLPTSIETFSRAFRSCTGLTSITLPDGLKTISTYAFAGCTGLTSLTLPESLQTIEDRAFYNCTGLTEIHAQMSSPATLNSTNTFYNCYTAKLYVPMNSVNEYRSTGGWSNFSNIGAQTSISAAKYATLYADYNISIPEGVEAYYGTLNADSSVVTLYQLSSVIPANTGVILYAEAGTYDMMYTSTSATTVSNNALSGVLRETPVTGFTGNIYTLAIESKGLGFYHYTGSTLAANKAFIEWGVAGEEGTAQKKSIRVEIAQQSTGIEDVTIESQVVEAEGIYDLYGRKVDEIKTPGIYVKDGKRIMIRK